MKGFSREETRFSSCGLNCLYEEFDDGDSFVPHRNRQQDIAQAWELGLETYLAQLEEKQEILDELLTHYNDGRRKTFSIGRFTCCLWRICEGYGLPWIVNRRKGSRKSRRGLWLRCNCCRKRQIAGASV